MIANVRVLRDLTVPTGTSLCRTCRALRTPRWAFSRGWVWSCSGHACILAELGGTVEPVREERQMELWAA